MLGYKGNLGMLLLLPLLALCSAVAAVPRPADTSDLVQDLPGLGSELASKYRHYSGYLDAGKGRMLFYWFIESSNKPAEDPLMLWLNGGPGCSSLLGQMGELGPFRVNEDMTIYENPYSWNTIANVLYLESPVCVGFSYSEDGNCRSSDDSAAEQNYNALKHFFGKYPDLRDRAFFLAGESYAGKYVPMLAAKIIQHHDDYLVNLQGFAVGNGLGSRRKQDNSLIFFGNYHGLLGKNLWDTLVANCCPGGVINETACNFSRNKNPTCLAAYDKATMRLFMGGLNYYSLYSNCFQPSTSLMPDQVTVRTLLDEDPSPRLVPSCLNYDKEVKYFNLPEVRRALHVNDDMVTWDWDVCSDKVRYIRQYFDMSDQYRNISRAGVRGLVYNGDTDLACNFLGDQWFVDELAYPVVKKTKKWMHGDQVAGFVKRFELLDFLTIKGAGHMVPEEKPAEALQMIKAFMKNTPY